jgi:hypothetical protein
MKTTEHPITIPPDFEEAVDYGNRRGNEDRRIEPCQGYAYVSVVGWICRREHSRRKDDTFECTL